MIKQAITKIERAIRNFFFCPVPIGSFDPSPGGLDAKKLTQRWNFPLFRLYVSLPQVIIELSTVESLSFSSYCQG
jgi:hypothetical protein